MHTGIASSSLRELDAVALATNVTVFMERDTKVPPTFRRFSPLVANNSSTPDGFVAAVENLCIVRAALSGYNAFARSAEFLIRKGP